MSCRGQPARSPCTRAAGTRPQRDNTCGVFIHVPPHPPSHQTDKPTPQGDQGTGRRVSSYSPRFPHQINPTHHAPYTGTGMQTGGSSRTEHGHKRLRDSADRQRPMSPPTQCPASHTPVRVPPLAHARARGAGFALRCSHIALWQRVALPVLARASDASHTECGSTALRRCSGRGTS